MEQAAKFAETTQILMNVSEFTDVSQATDTLISAVQAFGYTAETSMDVVDLLNTIGNNYAISTADLAQSLTKSSASLVAAGGDLAEAAALTATANKIIQDADSVGTALKTTSLRLRGTDISVLEEEGLDSEGAVTSKSKLQSKVKALSGVDILTATGEYKSTYEILRDIADVWESMNDMDQAALLELISGKRNSSVVAAILQNPEELKAAFEDANNASGSALKENEKYLDSIQGKIDQFNNAVQTMWSNTLDSEFVKSFVSFGTEIIKIIDKVGLLNTALITLATISMVKNKTGPIAFLGGISDGIRGAAGKVKGLITSLTGATAATSAYTAETLSASVANGALSASEDASIASKNGLALATTSLTAAEAAEILTKSGVAQADALAMVAKLGLTTQTQALSMAEIEAAVSSGALTSAQEAQIASALGLTAANTGLASSFAALWTALWPILAVMAGAAVIYGIVKGVDALVKTTEELTEELNDLKSELKDVQIEFESINSELETTQDRMSELLAKDKLSFTEEGELNNLKKQNDELQRRLDLLELEKKQKSKQTAKKFNSTMQKDVGSDFWTGNIIRDGEQVQVEYVTVFDSKGNEKFTGKNTSWGAFWNGLWYEGWGGGSRQLLTETEYLDKLMGDYQNASDNERGNIESVINSKFDKWKKAADGVDYGIDEQTDGWLDFIYNYQDRWAITSGGNNAKSNAINRILDKDENNDISSAIDEYVEALKNGDVSAKTSIENIIKNNADLVEDLEASGVSIDDAVAHFTQLASEANYATIEGKLKEIDEATYRLNRTLTNIDTTTIDTIKQSLVDQGWVDTDGNLMSDVIAEYFGGEDGGISEETRKEIERLVKQIYDGKISVEDALKSFELFGVQSVIDIQVAEVKTNFKDVFSDLEDVDGLVDTFEELGSAINSTLGALEAFNQAQADVADKGFVSIQTALQLMEYTDDYGSVLQVVDGKLQLAANAEQNLIQARIDAIKVSAQTAVADAQAAYDKAQLAVESYRSAMVEEASASTVATAWQKIVAVAAGIKNALDNIWSGESVGDLYNAGYSSYLTSATGYEMQYDDAGLQALQDALDDAGKKLNEARGNAEIANSITAEGLEDLYKSSDNSTTEEVADDAFQREMDYWENRISANQAKYEQIQNEIDLLESKGQKADASFYEEQIRLENQRKSLLEQQKAAALARLAEIEAAGDEGSEAWWDVANTLNDIEGELDDITASIVDLQDAIGEIDTYKFEEFTTRTSNLADQLGTIRELLADEDEWFNDSGEWTEDGVAALGTYIQELEIYKNALSETEDELAKYQAAYAGNEAYYDSLGIHSEQEYYDKFTEIQNQYSEYLTMIDDTEDAVVDMYESQIDAVEDYVDTLIDGYNDYIDSVKEALDAERDLYDFKKNVQKQAKDIAELERRIASLSGSTNAADIAERRKLEAQLYESRESLNDTYYEHAKESQQNALEEEASAYEESMNNMVEGLRTSLEEATMNMDEFLMGVTSMVMYNADTILTKYEETNLPLTTELTNPWIEAKKATSDYSGNALDLMNQWTKQGGFFEQFKTSGTTNLSSPWSAGTTAANDFKSEITTVMEGVVSTIESNVAKSKTALSSLTSGVVDTSQKAATTNSQSTNNTTDGQLVDGQVVNGKYHTVASLQIGSDTLYGRGQGSSRTAAEDAADIKLSSAYYTYSKKHGNTNDDKISGMFEKLRSKIKYDTQYYAKGTSGVPNNQLAIVDELGPELILHADPTTGRLQYLTKGSGVMTAEATAELMKLADIGVDGLTMPKFDSGINIMTNYITKPEFNIDIAEFVHVDRVDQSTLPQLEKMMDKKIDDFTRQLNYQLKKFK